ncbi:MAG: hypothetical protein MJZ82_04920 [Paludibacteraceae bacterium]|nr:hypothetical protein [Paludibacteraceae bacterium]
MTDRTKNIISIVCGILAAAYLVFGCVYSRKLNAGHVCQSIEVIIADSTERQFIQKAEVMSMLRVNRLYPLHNPIEQVNTDAIERLIASHPMVHDAECYITTQDKVCIRLNQRIPLLRISSANGNYLVDTERRPMPIARNLPASLIKASGNIGERMACNELYDFAKWLQQNRYWKELISNIRVNSPHDVKLQMTNTEAVVCLGPLDDYESKLDKLKTFHRNKPDSIPAYRELDLRFTGQVIGRK